jgi:hypothetical protein
MKRFLGLPWAMVVVIAALLALTFGGTRVIGGPSPASAAAVSQQIGMKVLLITDGTDCTDSSETASGIVYCDWVNTLTREGVPYQTMVTSDASPGSVALPTLSSTLADGTQVANYEGVVVATSGTVGMSTAQWTTLQTFEHQFSVRQVTGYAVPSSDYGMNAPNPAGGGALALGAALNLTADGSGVFPYLERLAVDPTQSTWAYQGTPAAGANVDTLVSGPNGSTLLGIYTSSDGRQTMFQTFNENQYYLQSQLLRHGELDWLLRNTYFGDQRNYLETNIDDNFLSDDVWSTATHSTDFNAADALREVPADVVTAAQWSQAHNFRMDMLFNGGGSVQAANGGTDPLLSQFTSTDPTTGKPYTNDFGWINHTWDHPNIDEGCATQSFIQTEITENTTWGAKAAAGGNPNTGGLGLTSSTDPTAALGNENPSAIVTGEHSGLANLIPGNPGQVDPPELNAANAATTGGTLATGEFVYAVSDQFNTAAPGATPVAGAGESEASQSSPVSVTGPTGAVTLDWDAVCHAADYKIYRAPYTPPVAPATTGTIGAWSLLTTVAANTSTDFTNTGPADLTYTDTGAAAGTAATPPTSGSADEGPYEQNPVLDAAFPGAGIKYFGSDASKPYPNKPDVSFATLAPGSTYTGTQYPIGGSFADAGATAIPRYPTNIYYNVSTDAQEVDEYTTLYDEAPSGQCVNSAITTCSPSGTVFTIGQIVASVDQGMFLHLMGNDPRPTYFHQTNIMSQSTGSATGEGTGLFYETLNPLLSQYNGYFASNAPIEQLTMAQIGTLLSEQSGWAAANASQISGYIEGNVVTVNNNGAATEIPLTGTTVGTPYAGTQSGWTNAPTGPSTYTALAAWPALPTTPVVVTPPTGPAPGGAPATGGKPVNQTPPPAVAPSKPSLYYVAVQVAPKTVSMNKGTATVSLKCQAKNGKAAKNHFCTGKFTLTVMGQKVSHTFRIKATKTARIVVKLPNHARTAAAGGKHRVLNGKLVISTKQPQGAPKVALGSLKIRT